MDNNLYGNLYGLYPQSNTMQFQQQQPQQQLQKIEVVKVNGRNGAEAFQIAPNSSTLLLDMNSPIVWFVMTDGAGYKTVLPYDITPHKEVDKAQEYKDVLNSIMNRLSKIEEKLGGNSNESNNAAIKPTTNPEWNI